MMERILRHVERRSEMMVDDMLDAIDDKLNALFGEAAVERGEARIRLRAKDLSTRRLLDSQVRFLTAGLR